jgi:hypothetical protein
MYGDEVVNVTQHLARDQRAAGCHLQLQNDILVEQMLAMKALN